jgi:hypothetical protein
LLIFPTEEGQGILAFLGSSDAAQEAEVCWNAAYGRVNHPGG